MRLERARAALVGLVLIGVAVGVVTAALALTVLAVLP